MFLAIGAGVFLVVLALCIDTIGLPDIPRKRVLWIKKWRRRTVSWRGVARVIDWLLKP